MKLIEFEFLDTEHLQKQIKPFLNKNYYFVQVDWGTDYRCCCRRYTVIIEVHDTITFKQVKNWFIETKNNYKEVDSIMISKTVDDLLNDRFNNLIGKADLEYKIKDYKNSIWKGFFQNKEFEERYEHDSTKVG